MTASATRVTTSAELQRQLCREVARVVGAPALRALHQRRAAPTVFTLVHVWAAIVGTFALGGVALGQPPLVAALALIPLAFFQGTRINALNVLVHEGSHHSLAASRRANVLLANLAAGYPILFDAAGYRHVHAAHHRYLGEAADPDRPLYAVRLGRGALLAGFAEDFLLLSLARRALVYARGGGGAGEVRARPLG
ncbi:MAG: fatty acid desaturase, partial [Deltaproteobacteria bacterium]|nr:fatty acid desaturase [Deltaproteobacteria bacterium]